MLQLPLKLYDRKSGGFRFQGVQSLHKPSLAPGCVVLVDHAPCSCFIQLAGSHASRFAGGLNVAFNDGLVCSSYISTGATSEDAISNASFLVLPVALDLRLDICQNLPPFLLYPRVTVGYFTLETLICPASFI